MIKKLSQFIFLNSRFQYLESDIIWTIFGGFFSRFFLLISSIYIAKYLDVTSFGVYSTFRNLVLNFSIFFNFGLTYVLIKIVSENINKKNNQLYAYRYISKLYLYINLIFVFFICYFSKQISISYFNSEKFQNEIIISTFYIFFNAYTNIQNSLFVSLKWVKFYNFLNFLISLIILILSICLSNIFGLKGALIALLIPQIILFIINKIYLKKFILTSNFNPSVRVGKYLRKKIIIDGLPFFFQEVFFFISALVFNYLLIKKFKFEEIGLFNIALQWSAILLFIPSLLKQLISIKFYSSNKFEKLKNLKYFLALNFFIVTFLSLILIFFAKKVLNLYGVFYLSGELIIKIIAINSIIISISDILFNYFVSTGKLWKMVIIKISKDVIMYIIILFSTLKFNTLIEIVCLIIFCNLFVMFILFSLFNKYKSA